MRLCVFPLLFFCTVMNTSFASAVEIEFTFYNLPRNFSPIGDDVITLLIAPVRTDTAGDAVRDRITGRLLDGSPSIYFDDVTPGSDGRFVLDLSLPTGDERQMVNIRLERSGGLTQELLGVVLQAGERYRFDVAVPLPQKRDCCCLHISNVVIGDTVQIVSGTARMMRGPKVVAMVTPTERLQVLRIEEPWIGTEVFVNGERVGGWIPRHRVERITQP